MELTLNLLWLLLTVPAFWLWQKAESGCARTKRHSMSRLLILGCVLVVLFPVISATDDLQAMRPEMEETGTRNTPGDSHHGKLSTSTDDTIQSFALLAAPFRLILVALVSRLAIQDQVPALIALVVPTLSGRAPPRSLLA